MGIRFECVHCGHTLHVKDFLAGKRGICPHCQGRIDIPATPGSAPQPVDFGAIAVEMPFEEQVTREIAVADRGSAIATPTAAAVDTSAAPGAGGPAAGKVSGRAGATDPISEAPHLHWYVLPPGSMTKYGPAPGDMMRSWISEGRVAAESLVWREGWPQWRVASSVFGPSSWAAPADAAPAAISSQQPASHARPAAPAGGAVVLAVDELAPQVSTDSAMSRRTKPTRTRDERNRNLIIGLLATLILVLLPLLIYVVIQQ